MGLFVLIKLFSTLVFSSLDYTNRFAELKNLPVLNDAHKWFWLKICIDEQKDTVQLKMAKTFFDQEPKLIAQKVHNWYVSSINTWNNAQQLTSAQQEKLPLKIPTITHLLWITSLENPYEIPEYKLELTIKGYMQIKTQSSDLWTHYIWVMDKSKIPLSVQKLELSGLNIIFKQKSDIDEMTTDFPNLRSMFYKN